MKTITVQELKAKLDAKEEFQLIDIREEYEVQLSSIGGTHIPLGNVLSNLDKIRKDVSVIMYCRTGQRSCKMRTYLSTKGYDNLYNLEGGINAWAEEIDNSITIY